MAKTKSLTKQQRAFIRLYKTERTPTDAARKAYPNANDQVARNIAYQNMNDPRIRAEIRKWEQKLQDKADIEVEQIVRELTAILMADPLWALDDEGAVMPLSDWPDDLRRALSKMKVREVVDKYGNVTGRVVEMAFWSKTDSAKQLLQKLGAFKDKLADSVGSLASVLREMKEKRGRK